MGNLTPVSVKGLPNFEKQVEYLLKFESVVNDIIELGKTDDDLHMLSFNANTVGEVVNKFPDTMVLKLNRLPGKGKDRLANILAKIKEFRGDAQSLQKTRSLGSGAANASKEPKKETMRDKLELATAQLNYPQPTRHTGCRVCCHLKEVRKERPAQGTVFFGSHLIL